jgi:hypothetical protein
MRNRNTPLRAFARKSPIKSTASEVAGEVVKTAGKQVGKKVLQKGLEKAGAKVLSRAIPGVGLALGAKEVFDGYGDLAKTKHGKQIIKDARMMPGKI